MKEKGFERKWLNTIGRNPIVFIKYIYKIGIPPREKKYFKETFLKLWRKKIWNYMLKEHTLCALENQPRTTNTNTYSNETAELQS